MQTRLVAGGLIAIVGGFLMIYSGYASHSLLYQAFGTVVLPYLGGFAANTVSLIISVLELINALGGITVVIGGLVLISGHGRTGRIILLLGGGAGFLGLLATFGYSAYKLGFDQTLTYAPYWAGLVLVAIARRVSKGSRNKVKAAAPAT